MAFEEIIGTPIPRGSVRGTVSSPSIPDAAEQIYESAQMAEIRAELQQVRESVSQLAETTAKYTRLRIENAAQTAVDRYPIGSLVLAALAGYWLAGRRH
jgi:hypothetical protein